MHDVRIDNPPGFAEFRFATISELWLDTDLLPLLRQRLIVHELRGRGRVAWARGRGRGDWIFESETRPADELSRLCFQFDWRRLVSEQAVVEDARTGTPRPSEPDGPAVRLRVDLDTTDVGAIAALLCVKLPVGGAAALAGELEFAPGLTVLRELGGHFNGVEVSGEVTVDSRRPRPRVSGHLAVPEVDLRGGAAPECGQQAAPAPPRCGQVCASRHGPHSRDSQSWLSRPRQRLFAPNEEARMHRRDEARQSRIYWLHHGVVTAYDPTKEPHNDLEFPRNAS